MGEGYPAAPRDPGLARPGPVHSRWGPAPGHHASGVPYPAVCLSHALFLSFIFAFLFFFCCLYIFFSGSFQKLVAHGVSWPRNMEFSSHGEEGVLIQKKTIIISTLGVPMPSPCHPGRGVQTGGSGALLPTMGLFTRSWAHRTGGLGKGLKYGLGEPSEPYGQTMSVCACSCRMVCCGGIVRNVYIWPSLDLQPRPPASGRREMELSHVASARWVLPCKEPPGSPS